MTPKALSREIKFRAWDVENNRWIYKDGYTLDELCANGYEIAEKLNVLVWLQFTGLHDKNGKEIYENDYLGDWCVYWGSGKYILQNISTGDIIDCNENTTRDKEVTGNKYETSREHPSMASDL